MKHFLRKYIFSHIPILKMSSVSRMSLDIELKHQFLKLRAGIVLEIGAGYSSYKKYIPHTEYFTLDSNKKSNPDICCDVHNINWESSYFDTVVAIEVLEHLQSPERAVNEIWRILKPGGICIASTRFIYPYHPGPKDYYRFTNDSLAYLFKNFSSVEIFHHGNRIQAIWQIINYGKYINLFLNILNPLVARIHFKKTLFPCGFIVYAKK